KIVRQSAPNVSCDGEDDDNDEDNDDDDTEAKGKARNELRSGAAMEVDQKLDLSVARIGERLVKEKAEKKEKGGRESEFGDLELAIRPPPPKICGSPGGPPITAPRIKLRDGRHLAYKEYGVPRDEAKHKFIFVHGFDSCRHHAAVATELSPDLFESLSIYIVSFDRPGYGESDPHPKRTVKSTIFDIEELADQLNLGPKFYVIGYSMGGQLIWGCLKYIPHRLAGATFLSPVFQFWWTSLPANITKELSGRASIWDVLSGTVPYYLPWLTYWWQTQKIFPTSSVIAHSDHLFSVQDRELISKFERKDYKDQVRQQGEYESIHQDMNVAFGKWEFDPMELANPFPNGEGKVHLWQGDDDRLVPVVMQRYTAQRLPWINYHEIPGAGHLFPFAPGMNDAIIKAQLSVEN
uniref:AB hydrolase-1 domain-containing protein n=1 Tax=Chenopodium quinoa TaxID=63459 RepID=A0A803L2S9_CHEQI